MGLRLRVDPPHTTPVQALSQGFGDQQHLLCLTSSLVQAFAERGNPEGQGLHMQDYLSRHVTATLLHSPAVNAPTLR